MNQQQTNPPLSESDSDKQQRLYTGLNQSLLTSDFAGSAAQAHGIASALCCRAITPAQVEDISDKFNLNDQVSLVSVQSLMEMSLRNLSQTNFSFDLWLPQDAGLIVESAALSEWCSGFIIAFLHNGETILDTLSEMAKEAIDDLIEIAGVEHTIDTGEDEHFAQNEVAFFEIREYVRMSVQLVFEELNPHQETEVSN